MRVNTTIPLSLSAILVLALAHAAPTRGADPGDKPTPRGGAKLARVPGAFGARMGQSVKKNGQSLTRQQILQKFNPDDQVDLDGGGKISVQELLDRVNDAETEEQKNGSSLTSLKKVAWLKATTQQKATAQHQMLAMEVSQQATSKPTLLKGMTAMGCTPETCVPKDKEKSVRWDKTKGDEDTLAAYTSFSVTEQTPDGNTAKCSAVWDNGAYLMSSKYSLVKLAIDTSAQKTTKTSSSKAALYVLGQASPVWSKDGTIGADTLDRTFKTPKANLSVNFIPLVSVQGGIQASATLSLKPNVSSSATATSAGCNIAFSPRLLADVSPEVKISVGIKKLVEIASGGVKAQFTLVDLSFPTSLNMSNSTQPLGVNLMFKSDVKASFLKGKVVAWYKIKDVCAWGYCLIEDGLGIDTSGEVELWEDADGIPFAQNLADINGLIPFQNNSLGGGIGGMGGLRQ